ncbi:MAG: glycosyltransferase [bacterium]
MKILFIGSLKFDYLQDLTYCGLARRLGVQNVIESRWNIHHHFKLKNYPKSIGYVRGSFFDSLRARLKKKQFDLVLVASCKPDAFEDYLSLASTIPPNIPVVFIDGGDFSEIGGDLGRLGRPELMDQALEVRPFDIIFKREYMQGLSYEKSVSPLPFSFSNSVNIPSTPCALKYDVAFWAVESHPIRSKALALLEDRFDCKKNGTVRNQIFSTYDRKGDRYFQELARCKIALNFRGGGWDTLRYWEVPSVGRFLISQKPRIVIPNDFENHESIVFCRDDLSDLIDLCHYYLKHESKREAIARKAKDHLNAYHTNIKRADYILAQINTLFSSRKSDVHV